MTMTGTNDSQVGGSDGTAISDLWQVEHIVVGVDGSPGAERALDWAAAEAGRSGARLTVLGAWAYGGFADTILTEDDAERVLREAEARARASHPQVTVEHCLVREPAARALIEAGGDADLLVVGSRGFGGFRGLLVGSVSQHCLTHAPCSVAIVRPPAEATVDPGLIPRRIVVGVDGSEGSDLALDWSIGEALRTGAELDVVGSWIFPGTSGYLYAVALGVPGAAKQVVDEALARVGRTAPDLLVQGETSEDPPAFTLVEASRSADLVVLGSRGLGAFRGLLLGSVSQHLVAYAHCSVVVVRERPID